MTLKASRLRLDNERTCLRVQQDEEDRVGWISVQCLGGMERWYDMDNDRVHSDSWDERIDNDDRDNDNQMNSLISTLVNVFGVFTLHRI